MSWTEKFYLCGMAAGVALAVYGAIEYYINRK